MGHQIGDRSLVRPNGAIDPVAGIVEVSDAGRLVPNPVVSVLMITYNHADYLAEAIEGVVGQHCDAPFELIIGDDASSDATRSVALHYQTLFPDKIRVLFSNANVGADANSRRVFSAARGEFVAYCEGDDYWCSPLKLSKQLEAFARSPDIGVVHTDWVKSRLSGGGWKVAWRKSVHRRVPTQYLQGWLFSTFHFPKVLRTCTVMYRRDLIAQCLRSALGRNRYRFGDAVKSAFVTACWRVGYVPEVTAVYRISPNSILRSGTPARIDFLKSSLQFDSDARDFFAGRADYPVAYRWEVAVGLLLWGLRIGNMEAVRHAIADLTRHFGARSFLAAALQTVAMRLPALRARNVAPPVDSRLQARIPHSYRGG